MTKSILPLVLFSMLAQGCFSSVVRASGPSGKSYSSGGASLFWGITTPTHGATQCEYGLKEVEMYRPWYSYLVAGITLGIVTPITSKWECIGAPSGAMPAPPPPPAPIR